MKKKLEAELMSIAHKILKLKGKEDINALLEETKKVYEKLAVLKFVEEHFGTVQPTIGKSEVVDKFEAMANSVMTENKEVPESNPNEEDLVSPLMDTIKDMVLEMPDDTPKPTKHTETLEDILSQVLPEPTFVKKEQDVITEDTISTPPVTPPKPVEPPKPKSLNDRLNKGIHIGLNDRIGFVKHLFDGSDQDYNRVISQLNTTNTFDEAQTFILQMVKPDYNNWTGKEEYETRFLAIVERKFS